MFYVLQNESVAARRRVPILLTDAATGTTAQAGVALTAIYAYVNSNGGAFSGGAGTVANSGFGQYYYEFDPGEIGTLGLAGIHITAAACRDYDAIAQIAALDFYSASVGASAYDIWNFVLTNSGQTADVQLDAAAQNSYNAESAANNAYNNTVNIANQVWGDDLAAGTYSPYAAGTAGTILYQLSLGGSGLSASDVWSYVDRTITGGAVTSVTDPVSLATSSMAGIANSVWSTLTAPYTTHATFGHQVLRSDNAATIGEVTLHQSGGSKRVDADVHAFVNNTASATAILNILTGIGSSITGNITGNLSGSVGSVVNPVDVSTASMSGIASTVWNADISAISTAGTAGSQLNLAALPSGSGITAGDVWDFSITGFGDSNSSAYYLTNTLFTSGNIETYVQNQTPTDIWTYADRTITGGAVTTVVDPVSLATSSMTGIAGTVWSTDVSGYSSPSAGFDLANASSGSGLSAYDVWNFDPTAMTSPQAGAILTDIQTDTNSIITDIGNVPNNVWASDVSGYATPGEAGFELTQAASGAGLTSGDVSVAVWDADPVNYSNNGTFGKGILRSDNAGVAGTVTLWTGASYNGVYADAYRIDGDYGAATALKNVLTGIGSSITGNITGDVSGSVGSVTADVNVTTDSMTGIAGTVWTYATRTLTSSGSGISAYDVWNFVLSDSNTAEVDLVQAAAGSGLTAGDVWSAPSRTITGGIADTVSNVTGNVSGSVGSVLGNVSGNVVGSVGSVTGNVSGNVVGSVASVTGNVAGSVGSVTGNVSGNVIGSVGSVTGNVSGNVVGSVASVTGNVAGSVNSVVSDVPINEALISADVWTYATRTLTSGAGISAADVWSYATRTVTGGVIDNATVSTIGSTALAGIATTVWRYNINQAMPVSNAGETGWYLENVGPNVWGNEMSGYTIPSNFAGYKLNLAASGATSNDPANVWSYATRTLTSGGSGISAADVWTYATRTITGGIADTVSNVTGNVVGSVGSVLGNVSGNVVGTVGSVTGNVSGNVVGSVASVLGNVSGNVVGSVGSVTGNVAGSVASVTGNVSGSVASVTGNVAGSVASVTSPVTFSSAQYASIASSVWNAATRTLTSGGSGISAYEVWNFVLSDSNTAEVDLVQAASGAGLTAGDVWTYGSRTITGGLADTVTSITNPVTVGTNNDKTGYALSAGGVTAVQSGLSTLTQAQVGTEVDSSLSDVGLTSTVTGRIDVAVSSRLASSSYETPPTAASIASSVWSAGSRTITGGTVDNLTNPATVATSSMTGIAGTVWNYSTRTITAGGGATAGDVWTYPTRSLTSGAGITVNAATNIINGPYFVKSNVDGQDGNLDVITGMVQDIQLTVTDAFGNPFDTTALGLAVNFYNQAGTLTTSYGTSQLYGPAGLVQFTLDAAVTGVEGRYNLILSAAGAGNTIKFGPLTTLVRPY